MCVCVCVCRGEGKRRKKAGGEEREEISHTGSSLNMFLELSCVVRCGVVWCSMCVCV